MLQRLHGPHSNCAQYSTTDKTGNRIKPTVFHVVLEGVVFIKWMPSQARSFQVGQRSPQFLKSGVCDYQTLASKRRYVIVFAFVFAMLLTPPDIISQVLLAVPMWFLFEVGLLVSRLCVTTTASQLPEN